MVLKVKLKIGAKVMLTVDIDIQGSLINCQTETIRHIEFAEGSVFKVFVKFSDEQVGSKAVRSSFLGKKNSWVPIQKFETRISIKKGLNIAVPQAYSIFVDISMGIYCS